MSNFKQDSWLAYMTTEGLLFFLIFGSESQKKEKEDKTRGKEESVKTEGYFMDSLCFEIL